MFVSFVFTLDVFSHYDCLIPFFKHLDMMKKYCWPIISHERYFDVVGETANLGIADSELSLLGQQMKFDIPEKKDIYDIVSYKIPLSFETELISQFPSQMDAWIFILKNNYEPFEELLLSYLEDIEKNTMTQIEGILCFYAPVSLRRAADAKKIPVFSNQASVFRPPFYNTYLFHIDRENFFGKGELEDRFIQFKKEISENKLPMLSRKGILKLFAEEKWLKDIHLVDENPDYELGILLLSIFCGSSLQHSLMSDRELLLRAYKKYNNSEVLIRSRPGFPYVGESDDSPTSFHFSCKCKRVAGIQSSGLFEALLVGRAAHNYNDSIYSFMCNNGIEDESKDVAPLDFINFVVFACLTPAQWIVDVHHLRFLLSNPSETDVYMKGFNNFTKHLNPDDIEVFYMTEKREYRTGTVLRFTYGTVSHESAFLYFTEGISECEGSYTWSDGDFSRFEVDLIEEINTNLKIDVQLAMVILNEIGEQVVTCFINDTPLESIILCANTRSLTFNVPKNLVSNKKNLIFTFKYSNAVYVENGPRKLAVAFEWLCLDIINPLTTLKKE